MDIRFVAALALAGMLSACAGHEGVFEPACMAYEGERIELRGGRYQWQRFSDERHVDENGKAFSAFPGFPRTGTYKVGGDLVSLYAEDGSIAGERYLYKHDKEMYLLTAEQRKTVAAGEGMPDCALRAAGDGS